MKISLIQIGKTNAPYLIEGMSEYIKRIKKYSSFDVITLNVKSQGLSPELLKTKEDQFDYELLSLSKKKKNLQLI